LRSSRCCSGSRCARFASSWRWLLSLLLGLIVTAALGLFVIGPFNLISVAFAVLFVGLGVDFGIQYCVRYRAERHACDDLHAALRAAAAGVGAPLALAAASTAAGFYSFLPTEYLGVSELGLIAGTGMLIAFAATITVLTGAGRTAASARREEGDRICVARAARSVSDRSAQSACLVATGIVALVCLLLLPRVRFDFNPLNLRSAQTESVSTALDLMRDPQTSPNTIEALAPSLAQAGALADRLVRAARGGARDHAPELRSRAAGAEARADFRLCNAARSYAQSRAGSQSADRCRESRGDGGGRGCAEGDRRQ
jgi:hypothetical protein